MAERGEGRYLCTVTVEGGDKVLCLYTATTPGAAPDRDWETKVKNFF